MSASTRPQLREHLHVGLRVIHTPTGRVSRIQNIWRADQEVQLVERETGWRQTVTFGDLLRDYEAIQPW